MGSEEKMLYRQIQKAMKEGNRGLIDQMGEDENGNVFIMDGHD